MENHLFNRYKNKQESRSTEFNNKTKKVFKFNNKKKSN